MAARGGEAGYDQLHHFVAAGVWDSAPLEATLLSEADRLVGGADAFLVIDDTAMPREGRHSVGVAPQYASSLGKNANCQTMVSVTLASPVAEAAHGVHPLAAGIGSEHRAKAVPPEAHGFMADVDAALGQQILDVPQQQRKAHVHQHNSRITSGELLK